MASNGTVRLLVATALAYLLVAGAPSAYAAITSCEPVVTSVLIPCISYIRSAGGWPPHECCEGMRGFNAAARTTSDRRTGCRCLKKLLDMPGLNRGAVAGLPSKCSVKFPYPIRPSTNCNRIR